MPNAAARKLEDQKSVVFAFGLPLMDQPRTPRHHFHNGVLFAEKVSGRRNAVTAEIIHRPAARLLNVPEMGTVRPAVRFRERTQSTRPMPPCSMVCRARTTHGANTSVSAYPCIAPERLAASSMVFASARLRASGFVQTWFFPARDKVSDTGRCTSFGSAIK